MQVVCFYQASDLVLSTAIYLSSRKSINSRILVYRMKDLLSLLDVVTPLSLSFASPSVQRLTRLSSRGSLLIFDRYLSLQITGLHAEIYGYKERDKWLFFFFLSYLASYESIYTASLCMHLQAKNLSFLISAPLSSHFCFSSLSSSLVSFFFHSHLMHFSFVVFSSFLSSGLLLSTVYLSLVFSPFFLSFSLSSLSRSCYLSIFLCSFLSVSVSLCVSSLLGVQGQLNITEAMEQFTDSLFSQRVPEGWKKISYASNKTLAPWYKRQSKKQIKKERKKDFTYTGEVCIRAQRGLKRDV